MTAISTIETKGQSGAARLGWSLLLVVSALLILNGVTWFFIGPRLSWIEEMSILDEFKQAYPVIAANYATNARQVAIWYTSFGLLSFLVVLEGFRHVTRWVWYATCVLVAAPTVVGMLYLPVFGRMMLGAAVLALVGQLLASKGLAQ